jgi:hypothetical protein
MPTHVFALEELSSNALAPLSVVSTIFLYQPHQQSTAPTIPSQTIPVDFSQFENRLKKKRTRQKKFNLNFDKVIHTCSWHNTFLCIKYIKLREHTLLLIEA